MAEDITIEMATKRLDNSKEVRVSRARTYIVTCSAGPDEWGTITTWDERRVDKIEDAVMYPYMYDATKIFYRDSLGTDLSVEDSIKNFELSLTESVSSDRKAFEMNMYTRKDENGVDHWNEKVFYSDSFVYDPNTGYYTLVIYTPAKSEDQDHNGLGYNDSVISVEENMSAPPESAYLRVSVEYRTNLPPCLIQGIPKKVNPSDGDLVFPSDATRVDIGVDQIPDYYSNSQGYDKDYLFTNSNPLYVADASGFLPSDIKDDYTFSAVSAYLENTDTTMITPVEVNLLSSGSVNENAIDVTENGSTTSYSAQLEKYIWRTNIAANTTGSVKNVLTIEASVEPLSDEV